MEQSKEYDKIFNERLEVKIKKVEEALNEEIKNIPKCIIQIFLKKKNKYINDATAILIKINKKQYIFSASHAISEDSYIFYNNKFILIPTLWIIKSLLEKNNSEDLYISELSKQLKFNDNDFYELDFDNTDFNDRCIAGFIGFPFTKNGIRYDTKEFKNRPYSYWSNLSLIEHLEYDNNRHLKMPLNLERIVTNIGGHNHIAPSPKGISGGAIFQLSESMQSLSEYEYDIKLIGIGIETWEKRDKALIGHKISHFINVMKIFNKLDTAINYDYQIDKELYTLIPSLL